MIRRLLLGLVPFLLVLCVSASQSQAAPTTPGGSPYFSAVGDEGYVTDPGGFLRYVRVVRPGIAVEGSSWGLNETFVGNIDTLLDRIGRVPSGAALLDNLATLRPLRPVAGESPSPYYTDSHGLPTDINVVISQGSWMANSAASPRNSNGQGIVGSVEASPTLLVSVTGPAGQEIVLSPETTLFHELVHVTHKLSGSQTPTDQLSAYQAVDPVTGNRSAMIIPTEEARTHGGLKGLMDANGGKVNPDGSYTIKPNPLAVNAIEEAAKSAANADAATRLPGGNTDDNRALARQAENTLRARQAVADLTEAKFASERGELSRPNYLDLRGTPERENWRLEDPNELNVFLEKFDANPTQVQEHPADSGVAMYREPRGGFVCKATKASCGDVDDGSGKHLDEEEFEKLDPGTRDLDETEREFTREITPEVTDPSWDDFADAWARMVGEHGQPTIEPAAEAVVAELSRDELAIYARVRVADQAARSQALDAISDPASKAQFEKMTGFTGDLGEAYRTGKVFVPTGKTAAGKLVEGWRFANQASFGVGVILWIKGLVEAFQSDSSDLDKATIALALVPGVGQILGILDGLQHKDPAFVVSNVTALLSFALEFCGQPELALVFGVVSLVAAVVDIFLNFDENDPRYQSYASWNIESRRDAAWKSQVAKGLLEKTIPALVTAASAAFDRAQREVLYSGYLAQAAIDAGVANAGLAQRNAAVAEKAQIRAATQQSLDALRTGFVSGSQGVEAAVRNAVTKLNSGDGFAEFTHGYLQQLERPDYVLSMYTGCRNGESDDGLIPDDAQQLACNDRKPYYGEHFDSVIEPQIQASTSPGGLVAATFVAAVGAEIQKQAAFVELHITDTDPGLKVVGQAASITSAVGGACLQRNGKGGQVATRAAGQCESLGWTVNPDHTITARDGLCLDAAGAGTAPGTQVITWDCTGRSNQQWTFNANGTVTSDASGLCLDITGGQAAPGVVELWSCNSAPNQRWSYRATVYPYALISAVNGAGRLTETVTDGVGISPATGALSDQQWTYVSDGSGGRLVNAYDNTCLQASATGATLADCKTGNADQQWMLILSSTGEGFQIRNMSRNVCLNTDATLGACTTDSTWRMTPNLTAAPARHDHSYVPVTTPGAE